MKIWKFSEDIRTPTSYILHRCLSGDLLRISSPENTRYTIVLSSSSREIAASFSEFLTSVPGALLDLSGKYKPLAQYKPLARKGPSGPEILEAKNVSESRNESSRTNFLHNIYENLSCMGYGNLLSRSMFRIMGSAFQKPEISQACRSNFRRLLSRFNVVHSQRCEIRRRRMMSHYNKPYHNITLTERTRDTCISDEFSWHQQRTFGIGWVNVHSLFWFTHYSDRSGDSMSLNSLQVQQATPFNKTWIWSRLTTVHSPQRSSPKMTTFTATFLGQPGRPICRLVIF